VIESTEAPRNRQPIHASTFAVPVAEGGNVLGDETPIVRKIPFFEADLLGVGPQK
jgi:hypothetical protein